MGLFHSSAVAYNCSSTGGMASRVHQDRDAEEAVDAADEVVPDESTVAAPQVYPIASGAGLQLQDEVVPDLRAFTVATPS